MSRQLTALPQEVKDLIRKSNLAYLFSRSDALHTKTKEARSFGIHQNGMLIYKDLPEGTEVWAFEHQRRSYSAYKRIGDEDYPVAGATIFSTGSDWTLITRFGEFCADAYVSTPETTPRAIGTV